MRAAVYDTSGPHRGELRVVDLPEPAPGPGEVRVQIAVAGVNPTDWKARRSDVPRPWPQQTPGQDGAGTVDAVGDGVDPDRVGERVWIYHAAFGRPSGSAAELACVPAAQAVPLPDDVTFEHGAGLGVPAITAHRCLFGDDHLAGRTVLVTGGAGAVGNAAIQLAVHAGARVVATVSSDDKARLAAAAGAHAVLRYDEPGIAERVRHAAPDGIDRVVEVAPAANTASYVHTLAPHAVVSTYARDDDEVRIPATVAMRNNLTFRYVLVYGVPQHELDRAVADLRAVLDLGALRPLPAIRFPLERVAAAHEALRSGVMGKVLLEVGSAHPEG